MAKKKRIPAETGPRNHLHNHPLLRKGGTHQKTTKAKRQLDKVRLKKEWPEVNAFEAFAYLWPFFYGHNRRTAGHRLSPTTCT